MRPVPAPRLASLDIFRGGTIASMILVNSQVGPNAYGQLRHAEWHGLTFTDLVFPSFLWIVGLAMTLSLAKRVAQGHNPTYLLMHIFRRSALIFLIGLALNALPSFDLAHLRIPGVLQRIAVCYLCAGAIYLWLHTKGRIICAAALLTTYWVLMTSIPVPGCGPGSLSMDCNFSKWIDGMFLAGHMYSRSKTWDPEGIISTLPAICNTLFGIFAGQLLGTKRSPEEKTAWLFLAGNALILLALALSNWMPINKPIWTVPYALVTSGIAAVVFASCYWIVDVRNHRRFTRPLTIFGVNALAIYIVSGLLGRVLSMIRPGGVPLSRLLFHDVFEQIASAANASLLYGLTQVALCFLVAWWLYRRNYIFRV